MTQRHPTLFADRHLRVLLSFILVVCTTTTLHAQQLQEGRFPQRAHVAPIPDANFERVPAGLRVALSGAPAPATLGSQLLAGFGGWLVGFLAGGFISASTQRGAETGFAASTAVAVSALVGGAVGSAIGVQWHGKHHGFQSPFIATLSGSLLGTLPIPVSPVTSPLGAAVAYNYFRRDRAVP